MENLRQVAEYTIDALKAAGASVAQCRASLIEKNEFNVDGGEFSLFRTLFDKSLFMEAIKDQKDGRLAINSFEESSIQKAIKECLEVAESGAADEAWDIAPFQGEKEFNHGVVEPDLDRFFERVRELVAEIKENHPLVVIEQLIASYVKVHTYYYDSNGTRYDEYKGRYEVMVGINGKEGDKVSSISDFSFTTENLDVPFIEMADAKKALENAVKQIYPTPMEGKFTGTMILTPGCLNQFLNFLLGNYAGDDTLIQGTSQWKDKLGEKVMDECMTISISPLDERIVNGKRFTGDGFIAENFDVIKDGVLQNFCISLYAAKKTGNKVAPNNSDNYVIEAGDKSLEDIIKETKEGIIVGDFSGGYPGVNGEFSGVAKNSYLVKDGEIKGAVTEAMINGNLGEIFNNVVAISKELSVNGSRVLPHIAVSGVVVSGK